MNTILQTSVVSYTDLCSRELINDLKEAANCDVKSVCRLACDRCPYVLDYIDVGKIYLKGLKRYNIELQKTEDDQLLLCITATGLDNCLRIHNVRFSKS